MALGADEQKVAAEMLRERLMQLQGDALVREAMAFRDSKEDVLRASVKAFAQTRLGQIEATLVAQKGAVAEMDTQKLLYEAALATQVDGVTASL